MVFACRKDYLLGHWSNSLCDSHHNKIKIEMDEVQYESTSRPFNLEVGVAVKAMILSLDSKS
jgi:hypothetical protein